MSEIDALFQLTCSSLFLLYPLGLDRAKQLSELGFVNAYIRDKSRDTDYKNPVYLLFKPSSLILFQAFLDEQYEQPNPHTGTRDLVEDYDLEGEYIVLVYQFPERFQRDYEKFFRGEYSKFSSEFRKTFPKTRKIKEPGGSWREELSTQYRIIYKDAELREAIEDRLGIYLDDEMEYWEKPRESKETLDIKILIETKNGKTKIN